MSFAERVTTEYFNYFSMQFYLIILILAAVLSIALLFLLELKYEKLRKKQKSGKKKWAVHIASVALLFVLTASFLGLSALWTTWSTARSHGYAGTMQTNAAGLWNSINKTPEESRLPNDLSGCIIIYYRFGCKDCEAVYNDLSEALSSVSDVYWIATRTETGQSLLETYPTDNVPSAVYIKQNGSTLTYLLYTSENGTSVLNEKNVSALINAAEYDRGS